MSRSFDHLVGERQQIIENLTPSALAVLRLITNSNWSAAEPAGRRAWRPESSGYCWPASRADVRVGSCVTSIAGPNGYAQLYERWRRALRGRQSGVDLKPPQAAVVKSNGGERCGKVGT